MKRKKIVVLVTLLLFSFSFLNSVKANENEISNTGLSTEEKSEAIKQAETEKFEAWRNGTDNKTVEESSKNMLRNSATPYWVDRKFYDASGNLYGTGSSKRIIDVSEFQGDINWSTVKNSGEVDGVIVRLGYGSDVGQHDKKAARNIIELNRLGIPYGVYLYSYASNYSEGVAEANYFINLMNTYGATPTYPIYYDLENWSYTSGGITYSAPKSTNSYIDIVNGFMTTMNNSGYSANVYSYRSYLQGVLNTPSILQYVSWVAAYTPTLGYVNDYYTSGLNGWQYTSNGSVTGISGRVDISAFYNDGLINYQAHVQDIGWMSSVSDNNVAGTSGLGLRMEALKLSLSSSIEGGITYRTHVQDIGWMNWVSDGVVSGSVGSSKRIEAVQINLTGLASENYDVYYRTHIQEIGWTDWASNGSISGSTGYSYRCEAIQIVLVEKGGSAPGSTENSVYYPKVKYSTHVQDVGDTDYTSDGGISGTTGKSLRLENIRINIDNLKANTGINGGINYATHIQNIGWSNLSFDGSVSGTQGKSLRLEAIKINLYGDLTHYYDVYYRVHSQSVGWTGWACNGAEAGTSGYGYRAEAIQIKILPKGEAAPGETLNTYYQK